LFEEGGLSSFAYASIVSAPVTEVFEWHQRPGALAALTPGRLVRIEDQTGGIHDEGRVTVSIGIGPARIRWTLRHYGYVADRRFCDEQVQGPFAMWRHAHLFEPTGTDQTLYTDRIEFAVRGGRIWNLLVAFLLRPILVVSFAHRHRVVRRRVVGRHGPPRQRMPTLRTESGIR
jgi:ligand-binding SRPBCC domain-containing protein